MRPQRHSKPTWPSLPPTTSGPSGAPTRSPRRRATAAATPTTRPRARSSTKTLLVLHKMLLHGVLRSLDFPVSTGKEANVFRGTTPGGGLGGREDLPRQHLDVQARPAVHPGRRALRGHHRRQARPRARLDEEGVPQPRALAEAKVPVPDPIKSFKNVLMMEYLGIKQGPWPTLKAATVDRVATSRPSASRSSTSLDH